MSLFNLPVERDPKLVQPVHPWTRTIKQYYANKIKRAHNYVRNPKSKEEKPCMKRVTFTVIGNRVSKEFIYCVNLVQGMHKYKWKEYDTPIIRGFTSVEWADQLQRIIRKYGTLTCGFNGPVVVLCDNQWIGGEKELKELIESKYIYHLTLNYQKESIKNFAYYLKSSNRPCAYMHISIDGEPIGSLIFMLYSDVVPATCENFLRLCVARRGGYSGTPIHRVVKDGWIQGGGFGLKSNDMDCENFIVPYDKRGVLGMANAEKHVDCSTQFFILLQPNDWLTACHRFVAFGQLIDGEETLKKIEQVETYYEAPMTSIVIYSAGIVNLDCHDILINKGAIPYLDGHIEDLVTVGELFYEMLMEQLWLEIEFRKIQELDQLGEEEESSKQIDMKFASSNISDKDHNKKIDFSMYETETTNSQVTPWIQTVSMPKETKPYIIPLTDVRYPGEVDSTFDLKRFLQGDYCLEADLDPKICKKDRNKLHHESRIRVMTDLTDSYFRDTEDLENMDLSSEGSSVKSDELSEIRDYIRTYGDEISFSGTIVKNIADNIFRANPLKAKRPQEKYADEDIRTMRSLLRELKHKKKVIIDERGSLQHESRIIRRPTGFVRTEDAVKLRSYYDDQEEDEQKEEIEDVKIKRMSMNTVDKIRDKEIQSHAYIDPEELSKAIIEKIKGKKHKTMENEEGDFKYSTAYHGAVRISPDIPTNYPRSESRASSLVLKKKLNDAQAAKSPLVLKRLIEDVTAKEDIAPALKEHKISTDMKNKEPQLALSDTQIQESGILHRDNTAILLRQSMDEKTDVAGIQMRSDKIEEHPFIRAREKAKKRRPSITVSQYRKMNDDKRVQVQKTEKKGKSEQKGITEQELKRQDSTRPYLYKGLRLPGDTPIYSPGSLSISND